MGNVKTRRDNSVTNSYINETFAYDAMDRLTSMHVSSDVAGVYLKDKVYRYDKLGNMTYQSGIGSYTYYADKPHALKTAGSRHYTYDAVGNTINRNGDLISYSPPQQTSHHAKSRGRGQ